MRSKQLALFVLIAVLSLALGACAPAATTTAPSQAPVQQEVTRIVAGTSQVIVITATPEPRPTSLAAGSVQINGAGATFPLPVYTQWTYAYQYVDPSVAVNYQGIGSGGGKKAIIDGTVDFAGSDSLVTDDEYTKGKDLQMYPTVAGAVVPIYRIAIDAAKLNGKPAPTLILDRQTLVSIYNAKITKWNDPAIVALNPDLKDLLPDAKITVVHRSDGSGTTELFTKSLTSFSPDWTAGGASAVEWPVDKAGNGVGGKGNPGVAAAVQNTPNSIGYVELSYAISNGISYASMVNKAGNLVVANAESLASAMNDFAKNFTDKLTNTIVDAPGAKSWPIAGYTYLVLHTQSMTDCVKAQKLLEYVKWSLTDAGAAKQAAALGYAVLPGDVQKLVLDKLALVTCNGNAVLK
ncbi:MAG: phosphate ABC transporter substrate-binding protein PstS [Anaerolineaceae bacterium]|nr:phosphate ABC transporter substrate-binding protein PstS [Anaerolineaceae bacterium]